MDKNDLIKEYNVAVANKLIIKARQIERILTAMDKEENIKEENIKDKLREYLCANLFDGSEDGTVTMPIANLLSDIVDILDEYPMRAYYASIAAEKINSIPKADTTETFNWGAGWNEAIKAALRALEKQVRTK